jgi:hypothetical protein
LRDLEEAAARHDDEHARCSRDKQMRLPPAGLVEFGVGLEMDDGRQHHVNQGNDDD